jgi:hypothetical protein
VELMPTIYYVSQTRGNDANAGTNEDTTPLLTIGAAAGKVAAGDTVYVGPGTYREQVVLSTAGSSGSHITWYFDPNCQVMVHDKAGIVRVTRADANELEQSGTCINVNAKAYNDFAGLNNARWYCDGSSNNYAFTSGTNSSVTGMDCLMSYAGISGGTATNCVCAVRQAYAFLSAICVNCLVLSADRAYSGCTSYNCTARGATGYGIISGTAFNCLSMDCTTVFHYLATGHSCLFDNGTIASASPVFKCGTFGTAIPSPIGDASVETSGAMLDQFALNMGVPPLFTQNQGAVGNQETTSTTYALSSERLIAHTPAWAGTSKGAKIWVTAVGASGSFLVELQKNIATVWTTVRSKTIAVGSLTAGAMNEFVWDTGSGDNVLTTAASTWRLRVTHTGADATNTIGGSASLAAYRHYAVNSALPTTDFYGRPRPYYTGIQGVGALAEPLTAVDTTTVHGTATNSLKITGAGVYRRQIALTAGVPVTYTVWVQHDGITGDLPQIQIRGLGISPQTATMTEAAASTWQKLTISYTPTFTGVYDIWWYQRELGTHNAYFSDEGAV